MKHRRIVSSVAVIAILAATAAILWPWNDRPAGGDAGSMAADAMAEEDHGPNDGHLLRDGDFAVEVTIFEDAVTPEFRIFGFLGDQPLAPSDFTAAIDLQRLGGAVDSISFVAEGEYLRGVEPVLEPHSFDVEVTATHAGTRYQWTYESHEGRTEIPARIAAAQGIVVEAAGPAVILDVVELTGTIQADPGRIAQVRARFPGIVTAVRKTTGDTVTRGESLGTVETNESLRAVSIDAPIAGLIVDRDIQAGQVTGDAPLFVIADLSALWVYLDVFGNDLRVVAVGQPAHLETFGGLRIDNRIDWVSPLVAHASQSVRARVSLPNPDNALRPGQFVRARVEVARHDVALAVRRSALQSFRDADVVFARVGDSYEVRMLELGRRDAEWVEVLGGLHAGERYVTQNSYLIKADIEKSGATHEH